MSGRSIDRESAGACAGAARRGYADPARLRSMGHHRRDLRIGVYAENGSLDASEGYIGGTAPPRHPFPRIRPELLGWGEPVSAAPHFP
jgi:hypothetical protein